MMKFAVGLLSIPNHLLTNQHLADGYIVYFQQYAVRILENPAPTHVDVYADGFARP